MYKISYYWGVPLPKVLKLINVIYLQTCFRNNEVTFVKKVTTSMQEMRETNKAPRSNQETKEDLSSVPNMSQEEKNTTTPSMGSIDCMYRIWVHKCNFIRSCTSSCSYK